MLSITLILVIITALVSIGGFGNQKIIDDLIFSGPAISRRNQWYRFITHGLIHADPFHLIFNMIALYSFGEMLEKIFSDPCLFGNKGKIIYLLLYVGGLVMASLPDFFKHRDNYHFRSLGASGAVSAVIFSSIVLMPTVGIGFMFLPVNIPGYLFGLIYLAVSAYLDKRGGGNINHGAHFWGALFGLGFTILTVYLMGHIDIVENFKQQLSAERPFIPFCNLID